MQFYYNNAETQFLVFTLVSPILAAAEVQAGVAGWTEDQILVVGDQAGAEVTGRGGVAWVRQEILRAVGVAVGGESVILLQYAVLFPAVEVVGQGTLLSSEKVNINTRDRTSNIVLP